MRTLVLLLALTIGALGAEPRMSWLDNGVIRLGVDLDCGGAITWLSRSGDQRNVINSSDLGREVQMSFYSGPTPFEASAKKPAAEWAHLGWNPVQAGDVFGHGSRLLEHQNDGRQIHVKCVPMQWPLDDVPSECTMESWLELEGPAVLVRGRLLDARADRTQYPARRQELPAVYTNGPWHRLFTYSGARPFAGEAPIELPAKPPPAWTTWHATENWSALLDDSGWGIGVWNPESIEFSGGFNGRAGQGGANDPDCGYLAPNRVETLDHDIDYRFRCELILGTLAEIRARVYAHSAKAPTTWNFTKGRQGWHALNATDSGWRESDGLVVTANAADPQFISPLFFTRAEETGTLTIEAAFTTSEDHAQIFWSTLDAPNFSEERSLKFPIQGDGKMRTYVVHLTDSPKYRATILQLRLDPANSAPSQLRLREIQLK